METKKMTSFTKNTYKNPSPLKTNAKQPKGDGKEFRGKGIESSENPQDGPHRKMSIGMATELHGKALGGHPEHRASEFSGKGKGHHSDMC